LAKLVPLDSSTLEGIAVHYTGSAGSVARLDPAAMLRGELTDHVDGRKWSDIAYQVAFSIDGRIWDCRGIDWRPAANGDQDVNTRFGAATFLLGVADVPTHEQVASFKAWRDLVWLTRWPKATKVVGHRDLHSTACPGDHLYALVKSGDLTTTGDHMTQMDLTEDALHKVAAAVWGAGFGPSVSTGVMLQRTYGLLSNPAMIHKYADAAAAAVVAALPAGQAGTVHLDEAIVARHLADELIHRAATGDPAGR
jgi:hypothetical protein